MNLPLTSLVPTIVEITGFIKTNWPHIWWFPNWYLGVPLRFVTGPIVPLLTIMLGKISGLPIETSYILLIGSLWTLGSIGVKKLVHELGAGKWAAWGTFTLFLLLPGHMWLFSYGNGLHHLAISLLPWVSLVWWRAQQDWKAKWIVVSICLLSTLLLIDVGGILILVVLAAALTLIQEKSKWLESGFKSVLLILTAFSIATIWYTPRFWWVLLGNPSLAGKPLANVIPFIIQLLQALIPLVLGTWFVQRKYRLRNGLMRFGVLFGSSFLFLTVVRFLSDIDFWMDWTSYILELQFALALVLPAVVFKLVQRTKTIQIITFLSILTLTIIDGGLAFMLYKTDEKVVAYQVGIRKLAGENIKHDQRIFLSGSPVFWLGDVLQIRGGRDEASIHPYWARGSFNIREGDPGMTPAENFQLLKNWLAVFGVSRILIYEGESQEYFKNDYRQLERFSQLEKAVAAGGNVLYQLPYTIARSANTRLTSVSAPTGGNDSPTLAAYASYLGTPLAFEYTQPNKITISGNIKDDEIISLAVTFDPGWKSVQGEGKLRADSFGNQLILPQNNASQWVMEYSENRWSWLAGLGLSIACFLLLWQVPWLVPLIQRRAPSLATTNKNEEDDY